MPVDEDDADIDLTAAGPLARSADDLALAMQVIADVAPSGRPVEPDRLRVALWLGDPDAQPSREVTSLIRRAAEALGEAGAEVREVAPGFDPAEAREVAFQLWVAASAASVDDDKHAELVAEAARTSPADRSLSALRSKAQAMAHRDWQSLDARRRTMARAWAALLDEVDVVLCPVSPVPAPSHDPEPSDVDSVDRRLARTIDVDGRRRPYLDQIMWNVVVGMARLPSTVAPVGRTGSGLPVGAQVVGPRYADGLTIAAAGVVGAVAGGYQPPPGFD